MRDGKDENELAQLDAALEPPNRMNQVTGLPHGWEDGDDIDLSEFR